MQYFKKETMFSKNALRKKRNTVSALCLFLELHYKKLRIQVDQLASVNIKMNIKDIKKVGGENWFSVCRSSR